MPPGLGRETAKEEGMEDDHGTPAEPESASEKNAREESTPRRSRVRSATDEDLERAFGSAKLLIGFPLTPEREHPTTSEGVAEGDDGD